MYLPDPSRGHRLLWFIHVLPTIYRVLLLFFTSADKTAPTELDDRDSSRNNRGGWWCHFESFHGRLDHQLFAITEHGMSALAHLIFSYCFIVHEKENLVKNIFITSLILCFFCEWLIDCPVYVFVIFHDFLYYEVFALPWFLTWKRLLPLSYSGLESCSLLKEFRTVDYFISWRFMNKYSAVLSKRPQTLNATERTVLLITYQLH